MNQRSLFHMAECDSSRGRNTFGESDCGALAYSFKGGLNQPSPYQCAQYDNLEKVQYVRDDTQYTVRPYACKAPGLYQPRMTINVPHTVADDTCFIQQKERLNAEQYNYITNLDKYQRRGVEICPTAGAGIRCNQRQGLTPGQLRSEFFMQGKGKGWNRCPGDLPSLPPDPKDALHRGQRVDSGLYPEMTMNRRGMIATHEQNAFERIGVTPKGPPPGGYAAMQYRCGFLVDSYQDAIDEYEKQWEEFEAEADWPSYY